MIRKLSSLIVSLALFVPVAMAADYSYVKPEEFKSWLESGKEVIIVDIQVPESFAKSHFQGALETNAYPVKSDEELARLDQALAKINGDSIPPTFLATCAFKGRPLNRAHHLASGSCNLLAGQSL